MANAYRSVLGGGGGSAVGDAAVGDVLNGKIFSSQNGIGLIGNMPSNGAVSEVLDTSTTSYTIPAGHHDGNGTVSVTTQTKSATPTTSAQTISADAGKVLSSVSVGAIQTQTKSATPSTTAQTITPDSGKYLTSVSVSAIQTQTKTSTPTTRSATAATVTPDSGKYLTSVTVNTTSVPNSNSGTYTCPTNWNGVPVDGGNGDMGATNSYQKVNAVNVYNKGKADAPKVYTFTAAKSAACTDANPITIMGDFSNVRAIMTTGYYYNSSTYVNYTGGDLINNPVLNTTYQMGVGWYSSTGEAWKKITVKSDRIIIGTGGALGFIDSNYGILLALAVWVTPTGAYS